MNRTLKQAIVVAAGLIVLGLLGYEQHEALQQPPPSVFSTYDTGRNGYRALYEVLGAAGIPVQRFTRTLGLLDAGVRTLIVTGYEDDPAAKPIDQQDAELLRQFVENGGHLVMLDTEYAGRNDITPGVPVSIAAQAHDAIALARNRYTAGVTRVHGPIVSVFAFRERNGIPLLANARGIVAISYRVGKGSVVAVTAPALFGNAHLRDADNLAFAYNTIAGHGVVAFDEYVHGYDDDATMWSVLPGSVRVAVVLLCVAVVLALIGANVPFAPPVPVEAPDERDSSAYIDAVAVLMRKARASGAAIAVFVADAQRRVQRSPGAQSGAIIAELEALRDAERPSDAVMLRAALLDFRLRKEGS